MTTWVKGDIHPEPDMYIFGFQELDLTTSALLYSTSKELEDKWTEAIMTSLGDAAGKYVKVGSLVLLEDS